MINNSIRTIDQYLYFRSVVKISKKLFLIIFITKNQAGFRPGDFTTNQLLFLVDEIHKAFEDRNSLEVRAIFLDKEWHDGLIFKIKQNGISGCLLMLLENYLHNRKQGVIWR